MDLMADAVAAGQVRAAGVSNYSADRCAGPMPPWHSAAFRWRRTRWSTRCCTARPKPNGVLEACQELGVTLIAYQPLASGALTGR
jgi:aryl-alcohol dehydrogenase-like predicted oxidoreductase